MAELVAAFGSSHTFMLVCDLEDWQTRFESRDRKLVLYADAGVRRTYDELLASVKPESLDIVAPAVIADRFADAHRSMDQLKASIAAAKLDALIIVGDDQEELFQFTNMPAVAIYYGDTIRNAARTPVPADNWVEQRRMRRLEEGKDVHYPCAGGLARHLISGLGQRSFDITAMNGLAEGQYEGHAVSFIHYQYLRGLTVPVVPILLNCFYPPNQVSPARCIELGKALGDLIAAYPEKLRVGILASGGLSHFVVHERLDNEVIQALRRKDLNYLGSIDPERLKEGSSEIRNWICVAGAIPDRMKLSWISYVPGYRTNALTGTGMCFATWE